jgi:carbonic anhydrase/acetyltransferase-like protein (isoleucine patch superfamily)
MPIFALGDKRPVLPVSAWIAHNAIVIGDVRLGANVSLWWNTVLRGDNDPITIGEGTNIQDGSVLHTDEGVPLTLGRNVTVGHMAMIHGCTVGDNSLIGIGAIILNRAVIGRECLIGAGSLIPEGKTIPDRSLVLGSPGKVVRQLTDDDLARIRHTAEHYIQHSRNYRDGLMLLDSSAVDGTWTNISPFLTIPSS